MEKYPSKYFEAAVREFSRLPGVGSRSALRMVLQLLKRQSKEIEIFGTVLKDLASHISYCKTCHNICESEQCDICADKKRDQTIICVVEDIRDVMAIENTGQYRGLYHLLGGVINPMEGTSPTDLNIDSLLSRANSGQTEEIIMALRTTMEGDTTVFYLYKKLKDVNVKISNIARGVSIGGELEYADEITLGRSIINRTLYENEFAG
ncbi:MAG: recombination protein RecR [Bacteroidia bacterium]|nr:recombination protein RecR [Bacteroidia bacterium]